LGEAPRLPRTDHPPHHFLPRALGRALRPDGHRPVDPRRRLPCHEPTTDLLGLHKCRGAQRPQRNLRRHRRALPRPHPQRSGR
ncbi:hypothetical protein BN1723_020718, partial [Verticillium longisporum]